MMGERVDFVVFWDTGLEIGGFMYFWDSALVIREFSTDISPTFTCETPYYLSGQQRKIYILARDRTSFTSLGLNRPCLLGAFTVRRCPEPCRYQSLYHESPRVWEEYQLWSTLRINTQVSDQRLHLQAKELNNTAYIEDS